MGDWVFLALLGAAVIHIVEEYVVPGGFADAFRRLLPRAAHLFSPKFHLVVNGVFLLVCLLSALIGKANLVLSLSAFGLIFTNAILHIRGAIVQKGYYPGVLSGALIYVPLAVYAFGVHLASGQITWPQAALSFALGALYMGVLMAYVLRRQVSDPARPGSSE